MIKFSKIFKILGAVSKKSVKTRKIWGKSQENYNVRIKLWKFTNKLKNYSKLEKNPIKIGENLQTRKIYKKIIKFAKISKILGAVFKKSVKTRKIRGKSQEN